MLKKVIETLKTMVLVLGSILIPLVVAMKIITKDARQDAANCVNTFMVDEGSGLSKYIGLQFDHTNIFVDSICNEVEEGISADEKTTVDNLKKIIKDNKDIAAISIYKEKGDHFATSLSEPEENLDFTEKRFENLKDDNILFSLDQLDDDNAKGIVIKYLVERKAAFENGKEEKIFVEISVKWEKYETYLMKLKEGSFPRMFYIVSPDCKRYVSLHSLPADMKNTRNGIALGLRLVSLLGSIGNGLSTLEVDSNEFTIFKEEIKMPKNLIGSKFSIIIATDDTTVDKMLEGLVESIPDVTLILVAVLLMVCVVLSRFYTKAKEQVEVSNTISGSTPLAITIFRVDDGKVIQINTSALTLFKIDRATLDTINMWQLFLYEDDKHYISNAVHSNVNVLNYEVLAQSFTGGSFWAVCSASAVEIEEQPCVILAVLDINRRKEIEKKLANNAALLENQVKERTADLEVQAKKLEESNLLLEKSRLAADEANAAKTKFLTNMSNELKTPINAIIGYSEILEEEALDRKDAVTADDLHKIISSARHLLSLIDEILDLSSIESGKTQLFFENVEITKLVKDVESVSMPLVTNNDNSLFLEIGKNIGSMYTDTTKIRQCLLNLVGNAAKFTQFGKITLRVTSLVKGGIDFIEFSVIDTGVGIAPDRVNTIFESFQDNKSKSKGAGLGLSITKKYTEVMGGSVSVESELGVGSKFTMRIPRKAEIVSSDTVIVKNQKMEENEFDDNGEQLNGENDDFFSGGGEESSSSSRGSSFGRRSDR